MQVNHLRRFKKHRFSLTSPWLSIIRRFRLSKLYKFSKLLEVFLLWVGYRKEESATTRLGERRVSADKILRKFLPI